MRAMSWALATGSVIAIGGCAGADNPLALSELEPVAAFVFASEEVETMHAIEISAEVREAGLPLHLREAQLEIDPPTGAPRIVRLSESDEIFSAFVRFYEPGEHHLHLLGQPEDHHLMIEMGEVEVAVEAQHQIYDGHRFELDVSPAPLLVGVPARVTVRGWEIEADQTLGSPAGGLELHAELHMPDGVEIEVELTEVGAGVYELGLSPPLAGEYELHVEIEEETGSATSVVAGDPDGEGSGDGFEFELYVPDPALPDADEGGDDGHGH